MENNISLFLGIIPFVIGAILLGVAGCIALYKGDYQSYLRSSLFIKTITWLPLYVVFCLISANTVIAGVFAAVLILCSVLEWKKYGRRAEAWYLAYFVIGCMMIPVSQFVMQPKFFLIIIMTTVVSDVAAFFFGESVGRHHLPAAFNHRKTYEGVIGQVVGGVVGIVIMNLLFSVTVNWWTGALVGILSAAGDLANSYIKRKAGIDSWGDTIPGHGGVMDRFSSLIAVIIVTTAITVLLQG